MVFRQEVTRSAKNFLAIASEITKKGAAADYLAASACALYQIS
jgi:hypothetical protein